VLERQTGCLGELLLGRLATQLDLEPACRARQLLLALDDMYRDANRACMVRNRTLHALADPPRRVGGELVATPPVELLDCTVQTERAFLDQIQERDTEPAVTLGDRHDQAQVRLDHPALGAAVAALDRLREHDLLVGGQQLVLADVGQEELQAVPGARRRVGLVDDRLRLGLRVLLLDHRFAHLEAGALKLAHHFLELRLAQVVLDRKRLELGRLDPTPLLPCLDQRPRALRLKQFRQLVLSQVLDVLSFLLPAPQTFPPYGQTAPVSSGSSNKSRPRARNACGRPGIPLPSC
jgi:hypothetical protein